MSFLFGQPQGALRPPPCANDRGAVEVARIWLVRKDGPCQVSLGPYWDEPAHWGILLADLVGHVANMYGRDDLLAVQKVRERVLAMFNAEINNPTDIPTEMTDETL